MLALSRISRFVAAVSLAFAGIMFGGGDKAQAQGRQWGQDRSIVQVSPSVYRWGSDGQYGAYNPGLSGLRPIEQDGSFTATEELDTTSWGVLAVLGFNLSDTWTLEAGGGYQLSDQDVEGDSEEKVFQVYGNAVWNIAPGFFIVPEIGYAAYDYAGDAAQDKPSLLYVGAKWQINF